MARVARFFHINAFLIVCIFAGALQAQPDSGSCKEDAARLCAGVQPGEGRIRKCLKARKNELSASCQARLASWNEARAGIRNACKADYSKHCRGKKGKAALQCLRSRTDLAPGCQEVLQSVPGGS